MIFVIPIQRNPTSHKSAVQTKKVRTTD